MTSLYLHIPFCKSKCPYCSFASHPGFQNLHRRYTAALCMELEQLARDRQVPPLDTLFIGGGTPTVLGCEDLTHILVLCHNLFGLQPDGEFSVEANPGTVDLNSLAALKAAGFNRLSIGVQSFNQRELQVLGRSHTADEAISAVEAAHEAGFSSLSLDLMYGLPNQTPEAWQDSLKTALSLPISHLSMYQLTIEDNTAFAHQYPPDSPLLPSEDESVQMDEINSRICSAHGFFQYEISNFSRAGEECRHNINYWRNGDYSAAGAAAVSYLDGVRAKRIADPHSYCQAIESHVTAIEDQEQLELEAAFRETVMLGLRMNRGVSFSELRQRFGIDARVYYGTTLLQLERTDCLEVKDDSLRLTDKGRLLANRVMAELI